MAETAHSLAARVPAGIRAGRGLGIGFATAYLSLIVLLPLAAVMWTSTKGGSQSFWDAISSPEAVAAIKLTLIASVIVALVNAVAGTAIAWVLVRDSFPGKGLVNAVVDLP